MNDQRGRSVEQTLNFVQKAAAHYGWKENPDSSFVQSIAEGLTTNVNRYGYYLCPCRDGDGDRKTDADIVCPCAYAAADITEYGQCFCGLFLAKSNNGTAVTQIPERRGVI